MTKQELFSLIKGTHITFNDGITADQSVGTTPRCVTWDYLWEDQEASDEMYTTYETYQVSIFTSIPRDPIVMAIKKALNDAKIHPVISIEYIKDEKEWHTYFAVTVCDDEGS